MVKSRFQASAQGQYRGRCILVFRALLAMRAGTRIGFSRRVHILAGNLVHLHGAQHVLGHGAEHWMVAVGVEEHFLSAGHFQVQFRDAAHDQPGRDPGGLLLGLETKAETATATDVLRHYISPLIMRCLNDGRRWIEA